MKIKFLLLVVVLITASCVGTKYLKPGEKILYKQKIKSESKVQKDAINAQLVQSTNSKILGMHPQVCLYEWGKDKLDSSKILSKRRNLVEKYDRKIAKARSQSRKSRLTSKKLQKVEQLDNKLKEGNLRMKWGEILSIYDSTKVPESEESIKVYLSSEGYFDAEVESSIKHKRKDLVEVTYKINKKSPYVIDSIFYTIQDSSVRERFIDEFRENNVLGRQYNQDLITEERDRIYDILSNSGYYDFKRNYILFRMDSTILGDHKIVLETSIANPPDKQGHKQFRLDSIVFTTESNRPRSKPPYEYSDITYDLRGSSKYSEKLLDWRIFLHEDSLYSKDLTLETQRQLSYLDVFKFVNIAYDSTGGKFIANIFTSPLKKYQTSTEVGLSVFDQSNGFPGPFFNFNAKSRNIFGGLEIIQFDGSASIQGIQGVSEEGNYSRLQYGGEVSVTLPEFLFPLKNSVRESIGRYNPRTKFSGGINFEDRRNEYERNTVSASMSYIWQVQNNIQFSLKPFDLSYIASNNSAQFKEKLDSIRLVGGQSLVSAFDSSFVSFSAFTMAVNNNNYGVGNNDASFFQTSIETGGNIQNILGSDPLNDPNLSYYKYLKTNFDFRQTLRVNEHSSLAYRFNLGLAYVYGSNRALPYEKYFFAGGSNSIRAWNPRRLGPGAFGRYVEPGEDGYVENRTTISNEREQPGDIIMESSIEFRHALIGFVDYALFLDAGNVWLWESNTVNSNEDPDGDTGKFNIKSFPREIAVGGGFGLRFDFSFLVLRFDLAYKLVDPAYPLGERFLLPDYKWNDLLDFSHKAVINIGIGYPF